jgi:uncharacterized FlaG/YvyC family protein
MKVSTISHEVVLPANVQVAAARSGSGKPAPKTQAPAHPEATNRRSPASEVKAPVEMVINGQGLGLRFFYDRDAGVQVIQVVDEESGDIIRQIPPDEVVDFMRQFSDTKGHFVSLRF